MPRYGSGHAVVVTGAGGGIGSSIALHLARCGYHVLAAVHREESLAGLAAAASTEDLTLDAVAADTSERDAVRGLFGRAAGFPEALHGVVLCAGVTKRLSLLDTTDEDFAGLIQVNLTGTFFGLREAGLAFRENDSGGSIVAVTSINAFRALPSQAAYSATKAGIQSLVASAAVEFGPFGVRVNALVPGAILTGMNPGLTAEDALRERIPLRRIGTPGDLDGAAEFLLGDDARYITGSSLVVDGGMMHFR